MNDIVHRYRTLNIKFNPGLSHYESESLGLDLNCSLPDNLLLLYQDHNGTNKESSTILPFRLMSVDEVREFYSVTESFGWSDLGVRAFWSDDNSNYAGLYISGPLSGCICFIDHGEPDLSPIYRSLETFLINLLDAVDNAPAWYDMPRQYPELISNEDEDVTANDWARAQALRPLFEEEQDETKRLNYAFSIINITPFEYTESLFTFMRDEDMYIQEKVCDVIGLRKYEAAVPALAEVILHGAPNGKSAAIRALGNIRTNFSREQLQRLSQLVTPNYKREIEEALKGKREKNVRKI